MRREEQEEKITSLLGGLDRVEAPHGFETRVMRRIAEGQPGGETHRSVLLLVLKFAAPAAMLLLMGMLFVFFGDSEVSNAIVPPVPESSAPITPEGAEAPRAVDGTLAATHPSEQRPAAQQPVNSPPRKRPASSPQIMSEDMAVQGPGETIRPQGFDSRPRNVDPAAVMPKGGIKLTNVLNFLGVNAVCANDGCSVSSVSKGSFADRAGLAAGDRIISIDGRAVNAATEFSGQASFKTFQVDRGGRRLSLSTKPN